MTPPSRLSPVLVGRVGLVALACGAAFVALPLVAEPGRQDQARPPHREMPDDPPGEVTRPPIAALPGASKVRTPPAGPVQVNVDASGANIVGDAANEPSIAVDPRGTGRMAIGWRQFDTVASNFRQAGWGYSRDSGHTWTFPGVIDPGLFRSDPVLGFDAQGNFYYNSLRVDPAFNCDVFTSTDGGATWGPAAFAFGGDKQWMTIDRTGGTGDGHVYTYWSTFAGCCGDDTFNRSTDGGATFEPPVMIPGEPVFGTLSVACDGRVFLAGADSSDFTRVLVARSSNARDPLATPSFDFTRVVDLGGAVSFDSESPNPGGLLGQVWVAADPTDANSVYVLAAVDPPGPDPLDVRFARSTDGGTNWDPSVRVNDVGEGWQWFAAMSVAPSGRIDAVWNDTRDSGSVQWSVTYYASSRDGGMTWSAGRPLTVAWNSHVGWPNQDKIGDYYDMISEDAGAHLAFSATFNDEQDVYYLWIED